MVTFTYLFPESVAGLKLLKNEKGKSQDISVKSYENSSSISLPKSVAVLRCLFISLSLYYLLTSPYILLVIIFVWFQDGACLILSGAILAISLFLTVSASKDLVLLFFIVFLCKHILSTLAEECGKKFILVMKHDNKENLTLS